MKDKNNKPKVSIVVPAYNSEVTIKRCIKSILSQTYPEIELVVVDDGSSDNTVKAIESITDERLILVSQKNMGVSSARNNGIRHSTGDYIMFADADDEYSAEMVETMLKYSETYGSDVVRCGIKEVYADTEIEKRLEGLNGLRKDTKSKAQLEELINMFFGQKAKNKCYVMALLIKRCIITENQILFDESLGMMEDVVFYADLFKAGITVCFVDQPLYKYYCNSDSISHSTKNLERIIEGVLNVNDRMRDRFGNVASINNIHFKIIVGKLAAMKSRGCTATYDRISELASTTRFSNKESYWKMMKRAFEEKNTKFVKLLITLQKAKMGVFKKKLISQEEKGLE